MARARTAPPRGVPVDCSSSNDARERDATRRREGAFVAPGRAESTPVATRNVTFLDARPEPGRLVPLAITDAASLIKFLVLRRPPVTWPLGTLRPRPAEIRRHSRCAYVTFLGAGSSKFGDNNETHAHGASRNACARRVLWCRARGRLDVAPSASVLLEQYRWRGSPSRAWQPQEPATPA